MTDDRPFCTRAHDASRLLDMAAQMTDDLSARADSLDRLTDTSQMVYAPASGSVDRGCGITPTQLRRSIVEIRSLLLRAERMLGGGGDDLAGR